MTQPVDTTPRSPPSDAAEAPPACPVIWYDSQCPVCAYEVGVYRKMEGGSAMTWIDANTLPEDERAEKLARMHVRRADGRVARGGEAFLEIWRGLPRFAWAARVLDNRVGRALLRGFYTTFLVVRRHTWMRGKA
ncbi:MAG: DCC1-like thiol-disulfide oxidoreductase family protein [Alphaproteobacteria bacterium]|nr:DCC1-like thiol-disulfide oxidoreductase family protein [Alphaproteobacteria bacterium]